MPIQIFELIARGKTLLNSWKNNTVIRMRNTFCKQCLTFVLFSTDIYYNLQERWYIDSIVACYIKKSMVLIGSLAPYDVDHARQT